MFVSMPRKQAAKKKPAAKKAAKKAPRRGRDPYALLIKKKTAILETIAEAVPIRSACLCAGIGNTTFLDWKHKGEANLEEVAEWLAADPRRTMESKACPLTPFGEFAIDIEQAEAKAESILVMAVSVKQPLEILKRRFRKTWGDRKLVSLEGTDGDPIKTTTEGSVNLNLTFEDPDDGELWTEDDHEEP